MKKVAKLSAKEKDLARQLSVMKLFIDSFMTRIIRIETYGNIYPGRDKRIKKTWKKSL